jgi:hypothetical protein
MFTFPQAEQIMAHFLSELQIGKLVQQGTQRLWRGLKGSAARQKRVAK